MAKLEELTVGVYIRGIVPDTVVSVVAVSWVGADVIQLTYRDPGGNVGEELVYRDRQTDLETIEIGRPWSFDGDGGRFRLLSEARRISLAYLFDPLLAVHTSLVEPLPHQITGVYEKMIPRQPLRFLLADDPGSGKTIMTGLFIKELIARGDLQRCLIVCPGNLVDQWQDELWERFRLNFTVMTNEGLEAARANWFSENHLCICRLDKLSRNEDVQAKLQDSDWDLVVCDEAHKMSASFSGGDVKKTLRYRLGELLSEKTRHFLLLTATPHNGKEEDFQLFLALLDGDRFEGRFRDGVHTVDTSDLMRRLVKEHLLKFDGRPLFPERLAYTVNYTLSDGEAELYKQVTEYVREEFNRADALQNEGRKGTVGFALTILQRRLASSPEAIYKSLCRRRERLEKRLREEESLGGPAARQLDLNRDLPKLDGEEVDELDDSPNEEVQETEELVVDQASAARTIAELRAEIDILRRLEALALRVRNSGTDRKWDELSQLLQNNTEMFDANGHRRKLIVFTEHRDTLAYLTDRVCQLLGRPEAVVTIHGSMGRDDRKKAEKTFTQDRDVEVLIATDAAGEGINLQRAHLMVNYDLPWNPNRLEQRFGRIHRIGQTEVCHLWNLVAKQTREGEVYHRLLQKLEEERQALGGQVFDVLGKLTFDDKPLRNLLLEAIRYGDQPEVRARLNSVVDKAMNVEQMRSLIEERALAHDSMDVTRVMKVREDMERAQARRLQPHYIASFFIQALRLLGGTVNERETRRYEISHVPVDVRRRDHMTGTREPVLRSYERITFEKDLISIPGKPLAEFVCPGHPLLDSITDLITERFQSELRQGAILVDEDDHGDKPRLLVTLEHAIQDATMVADGKRRVISKRMQFVQLDESGKATAAGYAPYLDYRPLTDDEKHIVSSIHFPWRRDDLEERVKRYAAEHLVPAHFEEVRRYREAWIDKTLSAVKARLTKEIAYWDHRAAQLKEQELAGKTNAKLNSGKARQRADDLSVRLRKRLDQLEQERQISPLVPVIAGGALIVPAGLLDRLKGQSPKPATFAKDTATAERLAMGAVIATESKLGYAPRDVSDQKCGYDIESAVPGQGKLRFIEVKGRVKGAKTVTITRNEIMTALNKPDDFILALVEVDGQAATPRYVRQPFNREPDFAATSVNYDLKELLDKSEEPA